MTTSVATPLVPCAATRSRAGFTLIELLVVIAIIGVLVSILLPTIAAAREAGRSTVCIANLRNAAVACRAYADDFKGKSPAIGQPYTSEPNWALVVQAAAGHDVGPGGAPYSRNSVLICPTVNAFYHGDMTRTYAINATGHAGLEVPGFPPDPGNYDDPESPAFIDMERVPRPDDTPMFVDSAYDQGTTDPPPNSRTASMIDFRQEAHVANRLGRFHSRQGDTRRFNAAFFDGSARAQWQVPEHWLNPLP
jgi:prepilin-type N-terminal cleavage/methylation domain-containing protein